MNLSTESMLSGQGGLYVRLLVIVSLSFVFLYIIYGAIWRLYFSPIAHIPGPRLAALTFWNETYYDIVLGGKYTWKIAEYHKSYGPIIRINPYEVHINDPDFFAKLYVGINKGRSEKWPWTMRAFGAIGDSLFTTVDHDLHRIRRASWNPYFSKQSIRRMHPHLVQPLVDKLCRRLTQQWAGGKPVVMMHAWASLTADIISEYSFPQGYNLLDKPEFDSEHYHAWVAFTATCSPSRHFPWLFTIMDAMPFWVTKLMSKAFYMALQEREHLRAQAAALISQRGIPVEKSFFRQSLLQALTDTDLLPEAEKTPERITAEAQLAMGAGTLTTSHCLRTATYHILANQNVHAKLMQEIVSGFPDPDLPPTLDQLEQMPYLRATMYESLRMFYGVSHRAARVFPDRAMQYKDWIIPCGTPVSMTAIHILDSEDIFPEPYRFQPERWLPLDTNGQRLLRYLVTFGGGSRGCVGLELAKAEILTSLACVLRRFGARMRLKDTVRERDVDTVYDMFSPMPSRQANGVLVVLDEEEP